MAGRGAQTFKKRQKEQNRKEKQEEKRAKRAQRRVGGPGSADGGETQDVGGDQVGESSDNAVPVDATN